MIEFISQLPTEYQEVEYIESSGTQYIDTGFMPNQDTRVVCDIDYTLTAATAWLFGARTSNEVKTYNVLTYLSKYRSDYNNKTLDCTSHVNPTGRFVLDKNKNITYFDNVVGVDVTYAAFQCDYTLYLFANNDAGTAAKHGTFKLFSCCVYDNGTLVRDFVPCYRKVDNVAGLYDLVNNVFYTNVGSGVFAVGANSNKHATATIIPGGVIPMQYALRRRMMGANGQKKIQWWFSDGAWSYLNNIDPHLLDLFPGPLYALAGMTWAEWCNSTHNPTPLTHGGAAIYVEDFYDGTPDVVCIGGNANALKYNSGTYVLGNDVIIAEYHYDVYVD